MFKDLSNKMLQNFKILIFFPTKFYVPGPTIFEIADGRSPFPSLEKGVVRNSLVKGGLTLFRMGYFVIIQAGRIFCYYIGCFSFITTRLGMIVVCHKISQRQ